MIQYGWDENLHASLRSCIQYGVSHKIPKPFHNPALNNARITASGSINGRGYLVDRLRWWRHQDCLYLLGFCLRFRLTGDALSFFALVLDLALRMRDIEKAC
jgi:hypothetical protein